MACTAFARVAQLVEQRTENPRVGGSNPPPGTIKTPVYWGFFVPNSYFVIAYALPIKTTNWN